MSRGRSYKSGIRVDVKGECIWCQVSVEAYVLSCVRWFVHVS